MFSGKTDMLAIMKVKEATVEGIRPLTKVFSELKESEENAEFKASDSKRVSVKGALKFQ